MKPLRLALALSPLLVAGNASALQFNLTFVEGTSQQAQNGFLAAAARYTVLYRDPITINLTVGTQAFASGSTTIGSTSSPQLGYSYTSVRNALAVDATTLDDVVAVANLASGPSLPITTNVFSNNPNTNKETPFDTSVSGLAVNRANAKALGLLAANDPTSDGSIVFNSNFGFDYDPSNGISSNLTDFVGVATHEIGHAMGFVSGVDFVNSTQAAASTAQQFAFVAPHDLFRRSGVSQSVDMTANKTAKYYSLDDGSTGTARQLSLGLGTVRGDGAQASHWKDNLGIGILDPTAARGELLALTANDRLAFDAMGYTPVPEPATFAALGLGALALLKRRKRA